MESFRERCARGLGQLLARFEEEEKTADCGLHCPRRDDNGPYFPASERRGKGLL